MLPGSVIALSNLRGEIVVAGDAEEPSVLDVVRVIFVAVA